MASLPQLPPPVADMNQEIGYASPGPGLKREAEQSSPGPRVPKKPRDNRLRDCFDIVPAEGGGEKISCKYCPDYNKTLQKFNPTKARSHLTDICPGVDDVLRKILLHSTQAAKRESLTDDPSSTTPGVPTNAAPKGTYSKKKGRSRPTPAYLSIHTTETKMDVTAPMENGDLIIRLSFPTNLKLNFNAEKNLEGAALCIDGFMNMSADASWVASLVSMTEENTLAGPHCQWSLSPEDASGTSFLEGTTRVHKVQQLLKTLIML